MKLKSGLAAHTTPRKGSDESTEIAATSRTLMSGMMLVAINVHIVGGGIALSVVGECAEGTCSEHGVHFNPTLVTTRPRCS